jgi:hypothetical protein
MPKRNSMVSKRKPSASKQKRSTQQTFRCDPWRMTLVSAETWFEQQYIVKMLNGYPLTVKNSMVYPRSFQSRLFYAKEVKLDPSLPLYQHIRRHWMNQYVKESKMICRGTTSDFLLPKEAVRILGHDTDRMQRYLENLEKHNLFLLRLKTRLEWKFPSRPLSGGVDDSDDADDIPLIVKYPPPSTKKKKVPKRYLTLKKINTLQPSLLSLPNRNLPFRQRILTSKQQHNFVRNERYLPLYNKLLNHYHALQQAHESAVLFLKQLFVRFLLHSPDWFIPSGNELPFCGSLPPS